MPAISLLIRTIGRKEALRDALESLRRQSFRDFEVVIVEDGPATLTVFLDEWRDLPVRYEASGTRQGRSAAGNRALALAEGAFCIFLDEDDMFLPAHLENLYRAVQARNPVVYSWSIEQAVVRDAEGRIVKKGR